VSQPLIIMLHFANPYPDHDGSVVKVSQLRTTKLIEKYVKSILQNKEFTDGDLYVGTSGIAMMFLKLHHSQAVESLNESALLHAKTFSDHSKRFLRNKPEDAASFLCGNAGIIAVSAVVHYALGDTQTTKDDLKQFLLGHQVCKEITFNRHGSDEILFGRAGYLSGLFWLNQKLPSTQRISPDIAMKVCDVMIQSGVQYSNRYQLKIPMMWECYGDRYLGAAHGICAILHMMLESPLFSGYREFNQLNEKQQLVKITIDMFLEMQAPDGNFPSVYGEAIKPDHNLIHW
jgi:Lanthionine synthetase C-like protein